MCMLIFIEVIVYYWVFVIFFIIVIGLCCFMFVGGWYFGGCVCVCSKNMLFELGIDFVGLVCLCFFVKFYLVVMFFVIFDVEVLYFYVWLIFICESGWVGFVEVVIFILVLLVGLVYFVCIGVLDWMFVCFCCMLVNLEIDSFINCYMQ